MSLGKLLIFILLIWICIRTGSYAGWTWKQKNRIGSIMLYILAVSIIVIPIYAMYFRSR